MFRVPADPTNPSFDHTFKVGFFGLLRSSKADRAEWARRRNAAAKLAEQHQNARAEAWAERKRAEHEERKRERDEQ